jgi:glycine/D-amino acid oxidase-like deaminating enzyme
MSTAAANGQPSDSTKQSYSAAKRLKRPRITVLGGGVIGLSAATLLAETYPAGSVTLAAERFLQDTTSNGAAGLWEPYKLGAEQDPELINRWGTDTFQHFSRLYASDQGALAGCVATTGYALHTAGSDASLAGDPTWRDVVPHFRQLSSAELAAFAQPYAGGYSFSTMICEGCRYLPWLTKRFKRAGGRVVEMVIRDRLHLGSLLFDEGSRQPHRLDCDILINCTGLHGARDIFGDESVYPIRGQVIRVVAPWIKQYYNIDGANYIIPNIDSVVLGGTSQRTGGDPEPDPADRQAILNNVCALLPSLRNAEIKEEWVGYRPGRPSVRLELVEEQFAAGDTHDSSSLPVIHNYGHGGAGITLSWGCAMHTLELVQQALG